MEGQTQGGRVTKKGCVMQPQSMQPHTPSATLGGRSSALPLILTNAKLRIIFGFRVTLFYFFRL